MPTFEGDNTVMLQQSSRFLMKQVKRAQKGKALEQPFRYLNKLTKLS